jgi:hypothetical protein
MMATNVMNMIGITKNISSPYSSVRCVHCPMSKAFIHYGIHGHKQGTRTTFIFMSEELAEGVLNGPTALQVLDELYALVTTTG